MNKSYVFFADGFEEIEALTAVDVLRRAGMSVEMVSINKTCLHSGIMECWDLRVQQKFLFIL